MKDNMVSTILYTENGKIFLARVCVYHNAEWAKKVADTMNKEENTNKYFVSEQEDVFF
jgi:hypothetical protein